MFKKNVSKQIIYFFVSLCALQLVGFLSPEYNNLNGQSVYLGAKGGWGIPQLSGGTNEISRNWKSRSAFNFGLLSTFEFSNNWALQIEVDYASQGGKKNGIQPISAGAITGLPATMTLYAAFKNEAIMNYIEIPVLARYTFIHLTSQKIYINAGPYFGYLINAHNKTSGTSSVYVDNNGTPLMIPDPTNPEQYIPLPPQDFNADTNIRSDLRKGNYGLSGGVGVVQMLGKGELFLDIQGYYGLMNIQKDPVNGKNNTGALVISLGYAFKL